MATVQQARSLLLRHSAAAGPGAGRGRSRGGFRSRGTSAGTEDSLYSPLSSRELTPGIRPASSSCCRVHTAMRRVSTEKPGAQGGSSLSLSAAAGRGTYSGPAQSQAPTQAQSLAPHSHSHSPSPPPQKMSPLSAEALSLPRFQHKAEAAGIGASSPGTPLVMAHQLAGDTHKGVIGIQGPLLMARRAVAAAALALTAVASTAATASAAATSAAASSAAAVTTVTTTAAAATATAALAAGGSAPLLGPGPLAGMTAVALVTAALAVVARFHGRWYERKCEVVSGGGAVIQEVVRALQPMLDKPYRPSLPIPDQHVETIAAAFLRSRPEVVFRRECLHMADKGVVALDWPLAQGDLADVPPPAPGAPVLILLPGLTGGSEDTYVRHMLVRARRNGWGAVVFNSRGCAHSPVTTPQFYSASFTEDLRQVVKHVARLNPESRLYAVGWSLGANILVRYLGQEGSGTPLAGAVSLCNPFDLVLADKNFHIGFNNVYDGRLADSLNKIFSRHAPLFEGLEGEYNIELVKRAKTVRDFDDGLTRVSFGYPTVDHYYFDASSSRNVKDVRIPLLCIQAKDDPIAPADGIPYADIERNPECLLVVTPYGGHLGWIAGEDAPFGAPWTDPMVMEYLSKLERMNSQTREPSSGAAAGAPGVSLGEAKTQPVELSAMEGNGTLFARPKPQS